MGLPQLPTSDHHQTRVARIARYVFGHQLLIVAVRYATDHDRIGFVQIENHQERFRISAEHRHALRVVREGQRLGLLRGNLIRKLQSLAAFQSGQVVNIDMAAVR